MTKYSPDLYKGLLAGLIAITVNTIVLKAAPLFDIMAESGGLLKLVIMQVKPYVSASTIAFFQTTAFWIFFQLPHRLYYDFTLHVFVRTIATG